MLCQNKALSKGLPLALAGGMSSICGYKSVSQGKWRIHFLRLFCNREREELCSAPGNSKKTIHFGEIRRQRCEMKNGSNIVIAYKHIGERGMSCSLPFSYWPKWQCPSGRGPVLVLSSSKEPEPCGRRPRTEEAEGWCTVERKIGILNPQYGPSTTYMPSQNTSQIECNLACLVISDGVTTNVYLNGDHD